MTYPIQKFRFIPCNFLSNYIFLFGRVLDTKIVKRRLLNKSRIYPSKKDSIPQPEPRHVGSHRGNPTSDCPRFRHESILVIKFDEKHLWHPPKELSLKRCGTEKEEPSESQSPKSVFAVLPTTITSHALHFCVDSFIRIPTLFLFLRFCALFPPISSRLFLILQINTCLTIWNLRIHNFPLLL